MRLNVAETKESNLMAKCCNRIADNDGWDTLENEICT